jgi:hypothetical protein
VEYACKEKAPRRSEAFPKALDFGFTVSAAARILGMSGNLTQRSPERVVHSPDQHAPKI